MSDSDNPQTPTRSRSSPELMGSSLQAPSTPPASPGDEAASVFSPNESVLTDITDYGWDSPSRNVGDDDEKLLSISLPTPQIVVEDTSHPTGAVYDAAADGCGTEPRAFVDDERDSAVSGATQEPDNVSSRENVSPNVAAAHDSHASESALTADSDKPELLLPGSIPDDDHLPSASSTSTDKEKWSPPLSRVDFTFHSAPEGIPNRRCSFNSNPNVNFLSDGQAFRNKPRAKSTGASDSDTAVSIQTFRVSIAQSPVPTLTTEKTDHEAPTKKDSSPAKPKKKQDLPLLESLKRLIPPSLSDVLVEDKQKCVATTQKDTRCQSNAQTPNIESALRLLNEASSLKEESLNQTTKTLFSLLLCGTHKNVAARLSMHWQSNNSPVVASAPALVLQEWLKAARGSSSPSTTSQPGGTPSVEVVIPPFETRFKTALPDFVEYHPPDKPRLSVAEELESLIVAPITKADADHSGHIYIYQCTGKFGYYKIGLTTDLAPRLQTWEKQCGRELMSYFPRSEEDLQPVQHISRVERLIHAELAKHRRKEARCPGTGCGKAHKEWFQVDEQFALRVVRKWITWMRKEPYVQINGGSTWVLDVHRVGSIREICTPLPKEIFLQSSLQSAPSLAVPTASKGRKRSKSMC